MTTPPAPVATAAPRLGAERRALVVAMLLTAACAMPSTAESPLGSSDGTIQLTVHSDSYEGLLTIRDEAGVVVEAIDGVPQNEVPTSPVDVYVFNPAGDPSELAVAWLAMPCETRPTITLRRAGSGALTLLMDDGPRDGVVCEAMGLPYGVTVTLVEPVAAEDVTVETVRQGPSVEPSVEPSAAPTIATPTVVLERPELPSCGTEIVERRAEGDILDAEVRTCFLDAYAAGQPAEMVSTYLTVEGHPVTEIIRLLPTGRVEVFHDTTRDPHSTPGWYWLSYSALSITGQDAVGTPWFHGTDCSDRML